ncbi:hypothetical protein BG004_007844 [Podila humilis]|nr:hypothetical protein BG004_007844 [Podila humilis]
MSLSHDQEAAAKLLPGLLAQEEELQFTTFSNDDALTLGCKLISLAKKRTPVQGITVSISRNGQNIFHHAMEGTSADNDNWVRRKENTVNRLQHSSYFIGRKLAAKGEKNMEKSYFLAESDYACHGGAFPLLLRGTGCIGAIVVSGLRQDLDHELVTQAIREFIAEKDLKQKIINI